MRALFSRHVFAMALMFVASGSCVFAQRTRTVTAATPTADIQQRAGTVLSHLPLGFEPNRGQSDAAVQFLARTPQATVYLSGPDAVMETALIRTDEHGGAHVEHAAGIRMHLVGANETPAFVTGDELPGRVNYLRGQDRNHWQTGLPRYGVVRLRSIYPGVDLKYYGNGSTLEYDFAVAPNADPGKILLQFQGGNVHLENSGRLALSAANGRKLQFDRPSAYQQVDGRRIPVEAAFQIDAQRNVTFQLGRYDRSRELVIDPTLVFLGTLGTGTAPAHTYLGQVTVDSAGEMFFIGTTNDPKFPVTANAYQKQCGPTKGNRDQVTYYGGYCPSGGGGEQAAYIAKLSADGTKLIYATYLSGQSGTEQGTAITVDSAGVAYLLGTTGSNDFPVTADAFQKNCIAYYSVFGGPNVVPCDGYYNGGGTQYTIQNQNAFFAKLSADGSSLLYSSFLAGTAPVYPNTIALDASGSMYLSGQVAVFDAATLAPCASGYAPGCQPNVQFPGVTTSGYQTISTATNNYGNSTSANAAAFLSKFSNDGHTLLYGTFFFDNSTAVDLNPTAMAVGANGVAFLGGYTGAVNLPTTPGAVKAACTQPGSGYGGRYCNTVDGYVATIDTTKVGAASLVYATRLGGSTATQGSNTPEQQVLGMVADAGNDVFVTGYTFDHTFNMPAGGYQATCPNYNPNDTFDRCDSAFVLKLNPTGTQLLSGSFLGGPNPRSAESVGYNVRLDSKGQVYLYGRSNDGGGDFPQVNPLQSYKGGNQLFISTFSSDMKTLLFSTRFGNPSYSDHSVTVAGGMALDGSDNIYFGGTTTDATFGTTSGTYATPGPSGDVHAFFAKLSKVLSPTATALTLTPNPANQGNNVTYKAVVTGTLQTTPVPTGSVTFSFTNTTPATTVGTATLDGTGTATLTAAAPAAGTYTVVATYNADTVYDVSSSTAGTLTASSKSATATTVLSSAPTAIAGSSVTFTASIASTVSTTNSPSGTVTFYDGNPAAGGSALGTGPIGGAKATYSTSALALGTHTIYAVYGGDTNFAASTGSVTQVVVAKAASTTTLSSSASSISAGLNVTFTAAVGGVGGTPTGTVTFLDGTTTLGTGTVTNGSATYTTSALSVGSHSITASYGGDASFLASTSTALTQTVTAATIAVSINPTSLTVSRGSSGTATITVTPMGAYTGTVSFSCGTLPAYASCTFAPATLTLSAATSAQSSTLTFSTLATRAALEGAPLQNQAVQILAATLFLPIGLLGFTMRKRRLGLLLLFMAFSCAIVGVSGCGGSSSTNTTAAGSYTVPVVVNLNGTNTTTNLSVIVQ